MRKTPFICLMLCALCGLSGCDPLTVHKVTSTIFDGVPSLPPAEQYCKEFQEKKAVEEKSASNDKIQKADAGSSHLPYKEKRCNGCHDKGKDSGLIKPKQELCFVCHPAITANHFAHGPAAVGSCLECHEPHSANYPALLKVEKGKVCLGCHKEKRLADGMHDKVTANGMFCTDCHDPHAGTSAFFLR